MRSPPGLAKPRPILAGIFGGETSAKRRRVRKACKFSEYRRGNRKTEISNVCWFAPTIERDDALSPDALKLRCPSQFTARYLYLAVASSKALSICSSSTLPALPPPQVRFLSARPSTPPFGLAGKRWCAQDQIPTVRGQKTRRQDCLPPVT